MRTRYFKRRAIGCTLAVLLAGCSIGPDFQPPMAQLGAAWQVHGAGGEGLAVSEADPERDWWNSFGDASLGALMQRLASGNLDLQIAAARLAQSRATSEQTQALGSPQASAGADYSRARSSANGLLDPSGKSGSGAYNVWQGAVQASWEPDLWGRIRRRNEAATARAEMAQEDVHAAFVSLSAQLAGDYIRLRGVQHALRITQDHLALAGDMLRLTRVRVAEGVATELEAEQAAAQVEETSARLPPLRQRADALSNAIGALLGESPQALDALLQWRGEDGAAMPSMPTAAAPLSLGIPSALARRRPDIRRAEAALHAATADIGVAEGDFYPSITLSASAGLQALQWGDAGSWGSRDFSLGPGLSLPLFNGGRLRAMLRLRTAQQQEAALAYRKTVLSAWHEVDDAIGAWQAAAAQRDHLSQALRHSRAAWDNARRQYAAGSVDYLHVLNAQAALLRNQAAWSDSRAAVSLARVHLYQSLGGGWQDAPLQAKHQEGEEG